MLYDPVKKVIGLVHAGWKGTVQQISRRAITAMQEYYGSQPQDILAGIGPSIGPDHYQVGMEVIRGVHETFGEQATKLLLPDDNPIQETDHRLKFDLWSANRLLLEQAGVRSIEVCNICTACHVDDWYSHRAEAGKTGRFGVVIALSH
jgi:YfiH family protein